MPAGRPWEYFDPSYRANARSHAAGGGPFRRTLPALPPPPPPRPPGPSESDMFTGIVSGLGKLVGGGLTLAGMPIPGAAVSAGAEALGGLGQVAEGDYVEGAGMLGGAATGTAAERLARHLHRRPSATALPVNPPVNPPARLRLPPVGVLPGALTPVGAGISPGQFQLNQALRPELWWLRP